MIYGRMKDVLAAGRRVSGTDGRLDEWLDGWLDGRMDRGMDGSDDGSLPCNQAVF